MYDDESIPIYIFISDSNEITLLGEEKYKMIGSSEWTCQTCFIENQDFDPFDERRKIIVKFEISTRRNRFLS